MAIIKAALVATAALAALPGAARASAYAQTNLVSNGYVPAATIDPQLQSPWGVAFSPTGPFWISDNNDNLSTLYNSAGAKQSLVVPVSAPTGQVFNGGTGFVIGTGTTAGPARFIFSGSDGSITAWSNAAGPVTEVTMSGSSYNGLAIATVGTNTYLYAADTSKGAITVFDSTFKPTTLAGTFTDPGLPAGYTPFNVQTLNGTLYVAYANFAPGKGGIVDTFDTQGNFIARVATGGTLDLPWGLDIAPSTFGSFANDLLVGNLVAGTINAYDPNTNAYLGQLTDQNGTVIANPGLWALVNGNGGSAGSKNTVYFTTEGPSGVDGLLGALNPAPEPAPAALALTAVAALALARRKSA